MIAPKTFSGASTHRLGYRADAHTTGRAFFLWVSVFNLFVVTVFWGFMTDIFNTEQAKRLFGFIAVGGTLGAIVGGH
ncbi:MAG: hypothetical protein HYX75_13490 [Acidobacteria bacterium]|nr:hypothetical protein [Acidobacteriota bacterium]